MDKIVGIIPCRKGSTRLKNKTFLDINGMPLIHWTINAAINSTLPTVYILTDYEKNMFSRWIPCEDKVKFKCRPSWTATNNAKYTDYLDFFVTRESTQGVKTIVLLQPTSPLRFGLDIDFALKLYKKSGKPSLVSAYKANKNQMYDKDGATLFGTKYNKNNIAYIRNSAIYIFDVDWYKKQKSNKKTIFDKDSAIYEMPFYRSVDINNENDLNVCRVLMKGGIHDE